MRERMRACWHACQHVRGVQACEHARLVVDAEGDELDDELHQEADRVDQVGRKVRVGLLDLLLQFRIPQQANFSARRR